MIRYRLRDDGSVALVNAERWFSALRIILIFRCLYMSGYESARDALLTLASVWPLIFTPVSAALGFR